MNYLVLLRHGQSVWNLENKFTGFQDVDLTPEGEREAKAAGKKLLGAKIKFDQVFSSTLKRAYRTARLALEEAGQSQLVKTMIMDDDLRERDYGALTGLNKTETREQYGFEQVLIWRRSYDIAPPKGESLKDVVQKRVHPYYSLNIKPLVFRQEKNVLVVAHGNSLRAMLIVMGVETPETINEAELPTGVPLVFELEKGTIKKRYFLDDKQAA